MNFNYYYNNNNRYANQNSELNLELIDIIKANDCRRLNSKINEEKNQNLLGANFSLDANRRGNQRDEPIENFRDDTVTLLHIAAFYDSLECFVYLHKILGLRLAYESTREYLPLHYACYKGSREIVAYILKEDPDQAALLPKNINHHFLYFAVYGGDPVILEELFKHGADLSKPQNKADDPIGKSIDIANIECLKVLLFHEKQKQNGNNRTHAMLAALNCHPKALEILINSPEDLSYFSPNDESVMSLMFKYSNGGIFKDVIIELLTKYPDVRIEPPDDKKMDGVCHWICKMCDPQVAELMVRTEDVFINRVDSQGHTGPYYLSIRKDSKDEDNQISIEILKILIGNDFDVNYRANLKCETILESFVRAMKVRYKIIEFLLSNGADPHVPTTKNNRITIFQEVMSDKVRDDKLKKIFAPYAQT